MTAKTRKMKKPLSSPSAGQTRFRYYDLKKNWRKVEPHLRDPVLNDILVEDFDQFTMGRWNVPFPEDLYPVDFEDCQWWPDDPKFKFSPYMRYVKYGAGHWLVNFALRLAMLVEPNREWRIITSSKNSTVWDGCDTLFEFNWQAFGVPADMCFRSAHDEVLRPGEFMDAGFPEPEIKRRQRKRKAAAAA